MPMSGSRLCDQCQTVLSLGPDDSGEVKEHHATGETFFQAIKQGCYICSWAWRKYDQAKGPTAHSPVHHTACKWVVPGHQVNIELIIFIHEKEGGALWGGNFLGLDSSIEGVRTKLNPSMRSHETFSLARQWVNECLLEHVECRVSTSHGKLPTRLVCIKSRSTSSELTAYICHGDTLPNETPYVTLSHCWGEVEFITTTRANLNSFESSLPIDKLSKTFQDAFLATINLGFQYIWIDSLCIVQDDLDDWKRESARMYEVYKRASCNVSASGFADGKQGFMLTERRIDPCPLLVSLLNHSSKVERSAPQDNGEKAYYWIASESLARFYRLPIFYRAWTLQEQLLSSRTIHFGDDQIYWHCKRNVVNEVWPHPWANTLLEGYFNKARDGLSPGLPSKTEYDLTNKSSVYKKWTKIVEDYSWRRLTLASDRLPALVGLADEFSIYLEDDYVYGLWSKDIHRGVTFELFCHKVKPRSEDIPSWSWAASQDVVLWPMWGVELFQNEIHHLCDIDLLHRPDTIHLRICGMLMECPSHCYTSNIGSTHGWRHIWPDPDSSGFIQIFTLDGWIKDSLLESIPDEKNDLTSVRDIFSKERILIMPILALIDKKHGIFVRCILLQAQLGPERGVYKRVGIAKFEKGIGRGFDLETFKLQLRAWQKPLDPHLFQEVDDGKYTIVVS